MIDLKKVYDKLYEEHSGYEGGYNPHTAGTIRFEKIREILSRHIPGAPRKDWSMLDVGCSTGQLLSFFSPLVGAVSGVDIADKAVSGAQAKGFKNTYVADVEHAPLPFPDKSFDFITCLEVIEHLFDATYLLSEIKRVLKPDGVVFIAVPNDVLRWRRRFQILFGRVPFEERPLLGGNHLRFFCRESLIGILEATDFKVLASGGLPLSYRDWRLGFLGRLLPRVAPDLISSDYFAIASLR